jgi:hypothetical protein
VLYRNGTLGPTYAAAPGLGGYSGNADYTWVTPPPPYPADRYELINGDQVIADGTVYKFYQLADRDLHPGGFGYKLVGTVIESFTLDPATGAYIYIYGVRPYNGEAAPFPLYLARVPAGGLAAGDAWQYYDAAAGCPGSGGWTTDPGSAVPLRTGASAGFSVTDVDGTYVLLTSATSGVGSPSDAVAYYAKCPAGFSPASPRYLVYQPGLPGGYLAYEYRIVPQFSSGTSVLVSYSVSATGPGGNLAAVSVYRPHFLDVSLPGIGGPAGAVTAPTP